MRKAHLGPVVRLLAGAAAICIAQIGITAQAEAASTQGAAHSPPTATSREAGVCAAPVRWVLLVDVASGPSSTTDMQAIDCRAKDAASVALLAALSTAWEDPPRPAAINRVRSLLTSSAQKTGAKDTVRWNGVAGQRVSIFVIQTDTSPVDVNVQETARSSRVEADFRTLIKVAQAIPKAVLQLMLTRKQYDLQLNRATLTITVNKPAGDDGNKKNGSAVATILTGPDEHWYLAASLAGTAAKQVTYDPTAKSLSAANTPSGFYLSVGYALTDLETHAPSPGLSWAQLRRVADGLTVSGFVEGSSKPLNQVGVFIGTRYLPVVSSLVSLETATPFVGVLWVRNDTLTGGPTTGTAVQHSYARGSAVVGLSLNMAQAVSWLGGGGSGSGSSSGGTATKKP